jgi:VanZ family protein
VIGAAGALVVVAAARQALTRPARAQLLHECYPMMVWAIVLMLASWHPFDASIDIGAIGSKVRSFLRDPWQQGVLGDEGVDAVRYAMFALTSTLAFRRLGVPRPRVAAGLAASLMACAFEFSQFFVHSRMPGLKDVTVGVIASVAAVTMMGRTARPSRVARSLGVFAASLAAALMMLTPLTVQAERHPFQFLPFRSYVGARPELAISHAVEVSLAAFPIGFLAAGLTPRRWVAPLFALVVGALLEYLQGWIAGRYPDVTDVAVFVLGAVAGIAVADRLRRDADEHHSTPASASRSAAGRLIH